MPGDTTGAALAAVWDGGRLVVDEVAVQAPAPGEVTVRLLASGICHSDLDVLDGRTASALPVVLGHEGAGVVQHVGRDVTHVGVGDAVMISSMTPCGSCPWCTAGRPARCPETYGRPRFPFRWQGVDVRAYANVGSFATAVTVRGDQAIRAAGIPAPSAALVGCAVSTGWGAVVNVAQVAPGQSVIVVGVGGIGVNAIAAARARGAARIVAVDLDPRKQAAARAHGAHEFLTDLAAAVPADAVIECSGAPGAIAAALHLAPTVALVGIPPAGTELVIDDARALVLGRRILGSLNGDTVPQRDLPAILDLIRGGAIDVAAQITASWPLARIHDAIAAVRAGDVVRAVVEMPGS